MVTAASSFLAEIIVPLVSFALEMCIYILLASARPWRYLFSSTFRAKVNAEHASKIPVIKWWHLLWGSALLIASASLIVGFVLLWSHTRSDSKPPSTLRQQAIEKAEQAALKKIKERYDKSN
ncbi:hypothetical protein [Massilia eburnea]|uniref:hypothetical protein n=1 Tax=Massilia eburnea TaxID=1776165 RepID=UPI003D6C59EE